VAAVELVLEQSGVTLWQGWSLQ